jgi:hypothetical protein
MQGKALAPLFAGYDFRYNHRALGIGDIEPDVCSHQGRRGQTPHVPATLLSRSIDTASLVCGGA